ncbi:hypothetical protein DFJ74DRAFT_711747 [Hyaloraphidium curvatum]|nr:hypothetical protein DFJ74DRAFT_711747 [Hyaloraphidium curvatum]
MADAPSEPGEEVADDPDAEAKAAIQNLELWVMRSYLLREGLFPDSFSAADPIPEPTIPFPSTTSSLLEFLSSTPSAAHLTLAQRYQLVVRETEELRDLVESERAAREAEEDELRARGDSLRAYITDLEREIREVVKADAEKDPRTGRVRNEAIAKQWEQSLRAKDATLSLLQLQNASLQSHARKLAARLSFRESTGESVRAVDFDQLRIENHLFSTRLAEMTRELLELKQRSAQPRRPSVKAAAKEAAKRKVEIEYPPLPQKAMNAAEPRHDLPSTKDFVEILKRAKQLQLKAIAVSTKPRM